MSADHDTAAADADRDTIQWCTRCERGAGDAETCPACECPTVPREIDPLGIVPDDFIESWQAEVDDAALTLRDAFGEAWIDDVPPEVDSIGDALEVAEAAPTTTPRDELPRCRQCGSTKIHSKPGKAMAHKRAEAKKCSECGEHFDDALPPIAEFDVADPVCPTCGSFRLVTGFSGEIECLDCEAVAPAAVNADAFVPEGQATLGEVTDG